MVAIVNDLKRSSRRIAGQIRREINCRRYVGDKYEDPICGGRFRTMLATGSGRPNALCPRCGSSERHRILWLFLTRETDIMTGRYRVLHFAPERGLEERLRKVPSLDYTTVDLYAASAMVKADITDLPFEDNSVDLILCNHVLEHVLDDHKAITEVARVLKPGGRAIMQHPVDMNRATTFEDPTVTEPNERDRIFYQHDHVRIYGRDFDERLRSGGLAIQQAGILYQDQLPDLERARYRVDQLPSRRPERDIEASAVYVSEPL